MGCRKFLSILIGTIVLTLGLLSGCFGETTERKLSEMEDDQLIQYMTDWEISIPENVGIDSIREMIVELEDDPDHPAAVLGWTVMMDLYEDIRHAVKRYYGIVS